jgi:hypothetical protein
MLILIFLLVNKSNWYKDHRLLLSVSSFIERALIIFSSVFIQRNVFTKSSKFQAICYWVLIIFLSEYARLEQERDEAVSAMLCMEKTMAKLKEGMRYNVTTVVKSVYFIIKKPHQLYLFEIKFC